LAISFSMIPLYSSRMGTTGLLTVRLRRADDDEFIRDVAQESFARWSHSPRNSIMAMVHERTARTIVAEKDGERRGFAIVTFETLPRSFGPWSRPAVAHLDAIAVRKNARRLGIGQVLLAGAETIAREGNAVCAMPCACRCIRRAAIARLSCSSARTAIKSRSKFPNFIGAAKPLWPWPNCSWNESKRVGAIHQSPLHEEGRPAKVRKSVAYAVHAHRAGGAIVVAVARNLALSRKANAALAQGRAGHGVINDSIAVVIDAIAGFWGSLTPVGANAIGCTDLTHRTRNHRTACRRIGTALTIHTRAAIRTQRRPCRRFIDETIAIIVHAIASFWCGLAWVDANTIGCTNLTHRTRNHRTTWRRRAKTLTHEALAAVGTQRRTRGRFIDITIAIVIDTIADFLRRHATWHAHAIRRTHLASRTRSHRPAWHRIANAYTHGALATIRT
jgi:GNAT superfamily N-acetyltransferase